MRLFVGMPLTGSALEQVRAVLRRLRERSWPVRWVKDDGLHLSLKFLGEVGADRLLAIEGILRDAADGIPPLELTVGKAGAFPNDRKPRVLRLEVKAPPELELLKDRLERAGRALGFPPEDRAFSPHVTLGRVREGRRLPREAAAELAGIDARARFRAERVILFESRLSQAGPVYRECAIRSLVA